jgi:hypothetical protein
MDTSSSNEVPEKKKPGPAPKPKVDVGTLQNRIHNLEELIIRMAHQSGTSHQLLIKAGLTPYQPTKNDMSKFKVV